MHMHCSWLEGVAQVDGAQLDNWPACPDVLMSPVVLGPGPLSNIATKDSLQA